jgi:hypothetical protein
MTDSNGNFFLQQAAFSQNMSFTSVEQIHRYAIVSELARGKMVLEIGLDGSYASNLVVQTAKQVVGMDVMPE